MSWGAKPPPKTRCVCMFCEAIDIRYIVLTHLTFLTLRASVQLEFQAALQYMSDTMKAVVIHEAGGPEVLKLEQRPIPVPRPGQALNQVKAFGLNRSEMFTRQDHSPVKFPRILGNEAVGMIEDCPGGEFEKGTIVATAVGELGREFDGGYAEYTCPPARQCMTIKTQLDWEDFGAMPEKIPTAYGSFYKSLKLKKGETLLVRGGTTSLSLVAAAIARNYGDTIVATSRKAGARRCCAKMVQRVLLSMMALLLPRSRQSPAAMSISCSS